MGTRNFITAINLPLSVRSQSSVDFFPIFMPSDKRRLSFTFPIQWRKPIDSNNWFNATSLFHTEDGEDCERMASTYVLFLYGSDCRMWNKLNNLATSV